MNSHKQSTTRIYLVRHGEVHNPSDILYGRLPRFRLSAKGRRQARQTAQALKDVPLAALYASPMLRARQTAKEILQYHRLDLRISRLINEVCTSFEGFPAAEADARNGDLYTGAAACYEQPIDVLSRMIRFFKRMCHDYQGQSVAAVTHGDPITFSILWAKQKALIAQNKIRLHKVGLPDAYPALASVTCLTFDSTLDSQRPDVDYVVNS